ncbi:phosphatidate cytidylyltransferase [Facilibium subflavum]|uniref:phosphatidate cytidylyltransferase n=1 Tax=Facilibium subflavum TaxID=2219058 RepID=UPI0013C347A7|nr:phosphatidate cytidylyltransferase [Facilibium subflavum]
MKERIITGVILGIIVLWAIFRLNATIFNFILAVILLFASWEWAAFADAKVLYKRIIYLCITAVLIYLSRYALIITLVLSCLFWLFSLVLIKGFNAGSQKHLSILQRYIMGLFIIVPLFDAISILHTNRPYLLLVVMLIVTLADSGAYFWGKHYGRHKLAVKISPNKTIEGLFGGLVIGGLAGTLSSLFMEASILQHLVLVILSFVTVLVALVGDLLESAIKRQCGVKDSGAILPGHGGVLDRMDSLFAALPVFVFISICFGIVPF